MNDSRDFKDAESVRSGQLSHVPCEPALFPLPTDPRRTAEPRQKIAACYWNTHVKSENVFANSPAYYSAPCSRTLNSWDDPIEGRIPMQESTGTPEAGVSDRDKDTIPTPRLLRSSSAGNSFCRMEGRFFTNSGFDQQRLQISELHFDRFPTPQTFSCWKIR